MDKNIMEHLNPAFCLLSSEVADLYPTHVEQVDGCTGLEPLTFYRNFVSQNRPALIKNAINHWPALKKWSSKYFRDKISETEVTVAVTPNGYADAICCDRFVMPEERNMKMSQFLDIIEGKKSEREERGVFYIQKQNSNMTEEFSNLLMDVDPHIEWGSKAFGSKPDAVNFWMGDARAKTSLHRDHYENLYCVISGTKTFTLFPPTDLPFMPYERHKAACYKQIEDGEFYIEDCDDEHMVSWIAVDPLKPDLGRYPQFSQARPITVKVDAGDTLYLPSLWFHHVQQTQACIAVNYWYDMEFDIKWAYYKFLEKLVDHPSSS